VDTRRQAAAGRAVRAEGRMAMTVDRADRAGAQRGGAHPGV